MGFALEAVLLLLFRLAYTQDIEIVLLPLWNAKDSAEVPLSFKAFDRFIELTLRRNDKITTDHFQVWKRSEEGLELIPELSRSNSCHYLHRDDFSSAAMSLCGGRGVHGLIFLDNSTLEITPLQSDEISLFDDHVRRRSEKLGEPHVVKRAYKSFAFLEDRPYFTELNDNLIEETQNYLIRNENRSLNLELALFFDEAGYNLFSPFFNKNDEEIRDMLLAYVNGVQAVYHHPSLGIAIDITLVRLEIMEKQPRDLAHYNGDRGRLLDSFCKYAMKRNTIDEDPNHWDLGLYVSGLDFYVMEAGRKNSATMGLAVVGGLCIDQYSCVIAELGVTNQFGKPFPSAGFTSVYIAAHEIGHNLGMHHDSTGNRCPKDGYIMSPSRGTRGETVWSECSRDLAQKLTYTKPCLSDRSSRPTNNQLDHTRFFDLPGREWTAKRQCELFLRDKDADVATFHNSCESLQCKTPHRSGFYIAGPALDGTYCAPGKECRGGECRNALQNYPGSNKPGGWSEWRTGVCKSGCLAKSVGVQIRERSCNFSEPEGCQGLRYDVVLCRDDHLCKWKRKSIAEYGALRCLEFSKRLPELDGMSGGLQAPHEPERPWMACAIFCRRKDIASYYTPRVELNDLGLDPYFPDGTWCHVEEGRNYFCRQHHCLPDSFRFEGTLYDVEFGLQNARAQELPLDEQIIRYFSLGADGLPLLTSLSQSIGFPLDDDEWIDKDYIDLVKPTEETALWP